MQLLLYHHLHTLQYYPQDRSDILCTYGITDDGKTYYFLEGNNISNGNIVATTVLVEAIDPLVVSSSIGVIDPDGNVVIPFAYSVPKKGTTTERNYTPVMFKATFEVSPKELAEEIANTFFENLTWDGYLANAIKK